LTGQEQSAAAERGSKDMAAARPYVNLGIADLESIFEPAHSDAAARQAITEELQCRNAYRSTALSARIDAVLNTPEALLGPTSEAHIRRAAAKSTAEPATEGSTSSRALHWSPSEW
jgi:hypothetical protein